MSFSGNEASPEHSSPQAEQTPPRGSVRLSDTIVLENLLPLANLSTEAEPETNSSPSENFQGTVVRNSDSLENLQRGSLSTSTDSAEDSSIETVIPKPRVSIISNPETFSDASFTEPKFSFNAR